MKFILTAMLMLTVTLANAQKLYSHSFGKAGAPPLIFLHGGPGYNSVSFEATTAQRLADSGFFVIVYDRRGEGRSKDTTAKFTFKQTFDDLNIIYRKYSLKRATLLGHSFGGMVGILYADKYPQNVSSLILISAPVALQESFKTIIKHSKAIYLENKDTVNLKYVINLEKTDSNTLEYSSYSFFNAMKNGFYSTKTPLPEVKGIYAAFKKDTLVKYASQMTNDGPVGFWKNEHYTAMDLTPALTRVLAKKVKVYGLYGKDDGLYSPEQVEKLGKLIGPFNLKYLDNCSHNVFIDRQTTFIEILKKWVK